MVSWVSKLQTIAAETKRRKVFKVSAVYAVTAWGASLAATSLLPAFGAPNWTVRAFVMIAALGLPIAIALAWAYDITGTGVVRDTARPLADTRRKPDDRSTVLHSPNGLVRVEWTDAGGAHERTFQKAFVIGRDANCELYLDDPMISRRHTQVSCEEGIWWVSDLGSRNGTLVNKKRITRTVLPKHSEVRLHDDAPVLRFEVKAASSAATVTSAQAGPSVD